MEGKKALRIGAAVVVIAAAAAIGYLYLIEPSMLTQSAIDKALAAQKRLEAAPAAAREKEPLTVTPIVEAQGYFAPCEALPTNPDGGVPDEFLVTFICSNGDFTARFVKEWSPDGVKRLYDMVKEDFFKDSYFFHVNPGRTVQFGAPQHPTMMLRFAPGSLLDEPAKQKNVTGMISFANAGRNSRGTQLFINLADNTELDADPIGYPPIGQVIKGMDTLNGVCDKYRDEPEMKQIIKTGNMYLQYTFPDLDYVEQARFVQPAPEGYQPPPAVERKPKPKVSNPAQEIMGAPIAPTPPVVTEGANMSFNELPAPPATTAGGVPDLFYTKFECSNGEFILEVHRDWAPTGAKQFYELVRDGLYNDCRFFRVVPKFMVQFGIPGDPDLASKARAMRMKDDPVKQQNLRGTVTYATSGKDSRTTQIFVNYGDNTFLDKQGFSPFAKVVKGMEVVEAINPKHGETPDQGQIQQNGNTYLNQRFPDLDFVKRVSFVAPAAAAAPAPAPADAPPAPPAAS